MRFVFCTLLFICSASLASLTREIGPQVIKGDPAAGKRSPPRSVVAPRLHMTDSALKFTHILYNLSPAGTVVPFSSFLFCVEQVHFLGSRCSLIFVVSSQHQFQLPPWLRYCWVMRTFRCLLSLKCFRTTHITPHASPWREACPGLSRGKIAAAVMFPNLPFLGLRDWDHLWRHVELVKWISSFLQSSMSKPSSLRRAHTSHQWVLLLLCLERKLADLQTISVL